MRFAIVGCGLIGKKRRQALEATDRLIAVADPALDRAREVASSEAVVYSDWRELIMRDDVDTVIVATPNDLLAEISVAALQSGKNVLVEKPAARNLAELASITAAETKGKARVHVGFNHRYHPGLQKAQEIYCSGELGPLLFIRGRYGHGGRVGYEREWRADKRIAGGGELIDQGVHLIDLARWFLGDFVNVCGHVHTYFWDMPVEDNAFLSLRTASSQTAWLHVSCTEWKNTFSFEVYGRDGKLHVEGLGGSYGTEKLTFYKMLPQMGPPDTTSWEYPGFDHSWYLELKDFKNRIELGQRPSATLDDAEATLQVIEKLYQSNQ